MKHLSLPGLAPPSTGKGFTLLELLITIVVAGILLAIAMPAFNSFVQNDRDSTQINTLVSSLNYARSEAVRRNTSAGVEVCPSGGGNVCNVGATWSQGIVVYDLDPTDATPWLQLIPAFSGGNVLTATGGGAAGVTFNSSGMANLPVQIKICDIRGGAYARDVEVNTVGSISSSQSAGKDAKGAPLACP